jgi:hypothetical protein
VLSLSQPPCPPPFPPPPLRSRVPFPTPLSNLSTDRRTLVQPQSGADDDRSTGGERKDGAREADCDAAAAGAVQQVAGP